MQELKIRVFTTTVILREQRGMITLESSGSPHPGSSQHIRQIRRHPTDMIAIQRGHMPTPHEETQFHRRGQQGVYRDMEGLLRNVGAVVNIQAISRPERQQILDLLSHELSEEQQEYLAHTFLGIRKPG